MTFSYETMSRAWFKRLIKSKRLNFSSGTEAQITSQNATAADRLTTSSTQIFASLEFDLSYAIVAARSVPLLQTKIFGFD